MARTNPDRPIFRMNAADLTEEENAINAAHAEFMQQQNAAEITTVTNNLQILQQQLQSLLNDTTKGLLGRIREESQIRRDIAHYEYRLGGLNQANVRLEQVKLDNSARVISTAAQNRGLTVAHELATGNFSSVDEDISRVIESDYGRRRKHESEVDILARRSGEAVFGRMGWRSEHGDRFTASEAWGIAKSKLDRFVKLGINSFDVIPKALKGGKPLASLIGSIGSKINPAVGVGLEKITAPLEQYVKLSRESHQRINTNENNALRAGVDTTTLLSHQALGKAFGGNEREVQQWFSSIATEIGGMQFGQRPNRLLDMAKFLGINLSGTGPYGMPTTQEVVRQIGEKFASAKNKMGREELAAKAHLAGIPTAIVRALAESKDVLAILHRFEYIEEKRNTPDQLQRAEESEIAWTQVDEIYKTLLEQFTNSDFSKGVANVLTEFGTALLQANISELVIALLEIPTKIVGGTIEFLHDYAFAPIVKGVGQLISYIPGLGNVGKKLVNYAEQNSTLSFDQMAKTAAQKKEKAIKAGDSTGAGVAAAGEFVASMFSSGEGVVQKAQVRQKKDDKDDLEAAKRIYDKGKGGKPEVAAAEAEARSGEGGASLAQYAKPSGELAKGKGGKPDVAAAEAEARSGEGGASLAQYAKPSGELAKGKGGKPEVAAAEAEARSGEGVFQKEMIRRENEEKEAEAASTIIDNKSNMDKSVSVKIDSMVIENAVDAQNFAEEIPEAIAKRLQNYGDTAL